MNFRPEKLWKRRVSCFYMMPTIDMLIWFELAIEARRVGMNKKYSGFNRERCGNGFD